MADEDRSAISTLLRAAAGMRTTVLNATGPSAGSPAEWELAACSKALGTDKPIQRVIVCADLWTAIAADQLHGVGVLLREGVSLFSVFPILRSVVEHGAATAWVLDDQIDSRERAKRAALVVLRSEEEAVKSSARMGAKGNDINRQAKQRYKATQKAVRAEFGELTQSGGWTIEGLALPTPTEMIEHFGARWGDARQWAGMYDYFCATANHPSLSGLEYAVIGPDGSKGFAAGADLIQRLIRAGLVPFLKAMEYFAAYMGWDSTALDDYIDSVNATLGEVLAN